MSSAVDFGLTAADYRKHRAGFPPSLFDRLAPWGIGQSGQQVVDVGTGTGTLARGFAARGCQVIGIDPAVNMLTQAQQLTKDEGLMVEYRVGRAEQTDLPANWADVVSAGQCWHWFDRPAAARELARILRPTGYLVIAHFDWLPLAGNVVAATEALIQAYNPNWQLGGGTGLYGQWLRDLGEGGYRAIESFSYDLNVPYSHADWRGRIRASAGVGASLPPERVEAFDQGLTSLLQHMHPDPILQIEHRVFAVVARPPL